MFVLVRFDKQILRRASYPFYDPAGWSLHLYLYSGLLHVLVDWVAWIPWLGRITLVCRWTTWKYGQQEAESITSRSWNSDGVQIKKHYLQQCLAKT